MGKSLLHRILGTGRVPPSWLTELKRESVVVMDEGIGGSITYRNFRAPGKRYFRRRSLFVGSVVLTKKRFAAFMFSRSVVEGAAVR